MPETKRTIAIDFDGVLAKYNGWKGLDHIGKPYSGAIDFVEGLMRDFEIVVHTCRTNPAIGDAKGQSPDKLASRIYVWLKANGFPEGVKVWAGAGKPIAAVYIDDRAIHCEPGLASDARIYFRELQREIRLAAIR